MGEYLSINQIHNCPSYQETYDNLFSDCNVVVSAPTGFHYSGELTFRLGGPTLRQHLPLRVFVGLKTQSAKPETFFGKHYDFNRIDNKFVSYQPWSTTEYYKQRQEDLLKIINNAFKKEKITDKFEISVLSEVPTGGGIGWAGAFSAALATALLSLNNKNDAVNSLQKWANIDLNDLIQDNFFKNCFYLAWEFEKVFQGPQTSGCDPFSSLVPTSLPIIYIKAPPEIDGQNKLYCAFRFNELFPRERLEISEENINESFPLGLGIVFSGRTKDSLTSLNQVVQPRLQQAEAAIQKCGTYLRAYLKESSSSQKPSLRLCLTHLLEKQFCSYRTCIMENTLEQISALSELLGGLQNKDLPEIIKHEIFLINMARENIRQLNKGWRESDEIELFLRQGLSYEENNYFGIKVTGTGLGGCLLWVSDRHHSPIFLERFYKLFATSPLPAGAYLEWVSTIDGFEYDGVRFEKPKKFSPKSKLSQKEKFPDLIDLKDLLTQNKTTNFGQLTIQFEDSLNEIEIEVNNRHVMSARYDQIGYQDVDGNEMHCFVDMRSRPFRMNTQWEMLIRLAEAKAIKERPLSYEKDHQSDETKDSFEKKIEKLSRCLQLVCGLGHQSPITTTKDGYEPVFLIGIKPFLLGSFTKALSK